MRIRPRVITKWGSLVALVLLLIIWTASRWMYILWKHPHGNWMSIGSGRLGLGHLSANEAPGWSMKLNKNAMPPVFTTWKWWFEGGALVRPGNTIWGYAIPLWVFAIPLVVLAILSWRPELLAVRRRRAGRCFACGYTRVGLAPLAACPECGAAE